jgi:hypothetical protein
MYFCLVKVAILPLQLLVHDILQCVVGVIYCHLEGETDEVLMLQDQDSRVVVTLVYFQAMSYSNISDIFFCEKLEEANHSDFQI